jgi:hypothetical protein
MQEYMSHFKLLSNLGLVLLVVVQDKHGNNLAQ